jgi:RNA polymerase sigma-70 factor (ECF subfamily)
MDTEFQDREKELLAEARSGSEEAFSELVRRHSGKLFSVSLRMLKNREDAEDNLQNALLKAYHNLGRFAGQSQFSTWLFRIAVNEALMKMRRYQTERRAGACDGSSSEGEVADFAEVEDARQNHEREYMSRDLANKALLGLNPALKMTFVLHKGEGWTNRELAEALGITVETVKSRVFRARSRARRRLELLTRGGPEALPN